MTHFYVCRFLQNSSLEFKLHQLQFITLIEKGISHQAEAMQYARTYLTQFVNSHEKGKVHSSGDILEKYRYLYLIISDRGLILF